MSTLTKADAAKMVLEHISSKFSDHGEIAINDAYVIENTNAWAFPYNTRKFLETRDTKFSLVGNAPILVCKKTGKLHSSQAQSLEKALETFSKRK